MAKAALEAINELDVFGAEGGCSSVIYCLMDEVYQCQAVIKSMLPRESNSKELGSSLVSIVSYPAFAIDDKELIDCTLNQIKTQLMGKYGCKRFLRDGYMTAIEDRNRLHYETWELRAFEGIENEWPVFFAWFAIDSIFAGNKEEADMYMQKVESTMIKDSLGIKLMPEQFTVPPDAVQAELKEAHSQQREPCGALPHLWGQSIYIIASLLHENFLSPGELDPLNRRIVTQPKLDLVVQVAIIAEDRSIQEKLAALDIKVQTFQEVCPINVYPARVLSLIYSKLGMNKRVGLCGRVSSEVGPFSTSKLYVLGDNMMVFLPNWVDSTTFYLSQDIAFMVDTFRYTVAFLKENWTMHGRPLVTLPIMKSMLDENGQVSPSLLAVLQKIDTGYIHGVKLQVGNLKDFVNTSCITNLHFLENAEDLPEELVQSLSFLSSRRRDRLRSGGFRRRMSVAAKMRSESLRGLVRRTHSVNEEIQTSRRQQIQTSNVSAGTGSSGSFSPPESPKPCEAQANAHLMSTSVSGASLLSSTSEVSSDREALVEDAAESEVIEILRASNSLQEQADAIQWLYRHRGSNHVLELSPSLKCTVHDLMAELYDKAGTLKLWGLVRHSAGILGKRVEELAKAVTALLVRQKQVTVGLPPAPREQTITAPLPPEELAQLIYKAYGEDMVSVMLTQELLIYLSMLVNTEPKLLQNMLRIRVGLIIQVLSSEVAQSMKISNTEALEQLIDFSPFEVKTLLQHILSGHEFIIETTQGGGRGDSREEQSSPHSKIKSPALSKSAATPTLRIPTTREHRGHSARTPIAIRSLTEYWNFDKLTPGSAVHPELSQELIDTSLDDRVGMWLRRRRLDGALNRVPEGFYPRLWAVLDKCQGIDVCGFVLTPTLTREMTANEMKFALEVEAAFNQIPQPAYRQLCIEAASVLGQLNFEFQRSGRTLEQCISLSYLVKQANYLFLCDQADQDGDARGCCVPLLADSETSACGCSGEEGICTHFYDSAPSGQYGTITYFVRAFSNYLISLDQGMLECTVQ